MSSLPLTVQVLDNAATSDGFRAAKEHTNIAPRAFGLAQFMDGFNRMEEGMFFVARLISAWQGIKYAKELDPAKHYLKIKRAEGYDLSLKYLSPLKQ